MRDKQELARQAKEGKGLSVEDTAGAKTQWWEGAGNTEVGTAGIGVKRARGSGLHDAGQAQQHTRGKAVCQALL